VHLGDGYWKSSIQKGWIFTSVRQIDELRGAGEKIDAPRSVEYEIAKWHASFGPGLIVFSNELFQTLISFPTESLRTISLNLRQYWQVQDA
jgi:hypothetical protein